MENKIKFCELYPECFIDETDPTNTDIDNPYNIFKQRGLYFIHLNINSILPKIDQLRQIASKTNAAIFVLSETKLDDSVLDGEISINGCKRNIKFIP